MSFDRFGNMTDLEFCQMIAAERNAMQNLNMEDFEVNPIQMHKLRELVQFFMDRFDDMGGEFVDVTVDPRVLPYGVTVKFDVFDLSGREIVQFCENLLNCTAISMDATADDKVCISCTVPNVFIPKS